MDRIGNDLNSELSKNFKWVFTSFAKCRNNVVAQFVNNKCRTRHPMKHVYDSIG